MGRTDGCDQQSSEKAEGGGRGKGDAWQGGGGGRKWMPKRTKRLRLTVSLRGGHFVSPGS